MPEWNGGILILLATRGIINHMERETSSRCLRQRTPLWNKKFILSNEVCSTRVVPGSERPKQTRSGTLCNGARGGNHLIVRAFTTPLAVPTSTVFDPSIGRKYLPCSNRESKGPRRRLDGCRGIHHTLSPSCAKGGTARLPTFLSYADHHKPTVHAGG